MNATWKQNSPKAKKQTIKFFLFFLHSPVTFTCFLSLFLSALFPLSLNRPNLSIKIKGTKDVSYVQPKGKKKKSNFLFDNFSYRAKSAPRSEVSGWRKSVIEQTKKELKISILSREAKKILLCKVGWDYHRYPYTQPSIGRNQIWQLLPRMIKSQAQHSHPLFFLFWCLW